MDRVSISKSFNFKKTKMEEFKNFEIKNQCLIRGGDCQNTTWTSGDETESGCDVIENGKVKYVDCKPVV